MIVVKYVSEVWAFQKIGEDLVDFFSREIVCGLFWPPSCLTVFQTIDSEISSSVTLLRTIMREWLR